MNGSGSLLGSGQVRISHEQVSTPATPQEWVSTKPLTRDATGHRRKSGKKNAFMDSCIVDSFLTQRGFDSPRISYSPSINVSPKSTLLQARHVLNHGDPYADCWGKQ